VEFVRARRAIFGVRRLDGALGRVSTGSDSDRTEARFDVHMIQSLPLAVLTQSGVKPPHSKMLRLI
jgi:hypothetical protein